MKSSSNAYSESAKNELAFSGRSLSVRQFLHRALMSLASNCKRLSTQSLKWDTAKVVHVTDGLLRCVGRSVHGSGAAGGCEGRPQEADLHDVHLDHRVRHSQLQGHPLRLHWRGWSGGRHLIAFVFVARKQRIAPGQSSRLQYRSKFSHCPEH